MQLRALAAYQQAIGQMHVGDTRNALRRPTQMEQRPSVPAPLVVELFTRSGRAQVTALGVHVDKRV